LFIILLFAYPRKTLSFLAVFLMIGTYYISHILPITESSVGQEMSYFGITNINKPIGIRIPDFKIIDNVLQEP